LQNRKGKVRNKKDWVFTLVPLLMLGSICDHLKQGNVKGYAYHSVHSFILSLITYLSSDMQEELSLIILFQSRHHEDNY